LKFLSLLDEEGVDLPAGTAIAAGCLGRVSSSAVLMIG
jgi:hypothetical protein